MAHHKAFTLTSEQIAAAGRNSGILMDKFGKDVVIEFTKRDGSERVLKGSVHAFIGREDKAAVQILTKDGYRSANLWAIKSIK